MSKQDPASLDQHLQIGLAISIQGSSQEELAASVSTSCSGEIWLELSRPSPQPPFQEDERVRIKYWDEGAIVYCWEADVVKIAGPEYQHVAISIRGKGMTMQRRRAYRVNLPVPLSFSVIDAADAELIGEKLLKSKTQNISVAGLRFETSLGLKAGDKLDMNLFLPASQPVNAVGWVVRTEAVEHQGKSLNSVALKFLQLKEEDQIQLLEFLAQSYDEATAKSAQTTVSNQAHSSVLQPVRTRDRPSGRPGRGVNQNRPQKSLTSP